MKKRKFIVTTLILIGVFALLFSKMLARPVNNLDELWNYNTARQIMNGLIPYKDISMITTPLLPTIIAIILRVTVDELIVFRIITALIAVAIMFLTYQILNILLKNKLISCILVGGILLIYYEYFMLDYNFVVLLIALIIEYLEIKKLENETEIKKDNKYNLAIGILAGFAVCTKQTVGAFVALGTLLVQLLFISNKENLKQYLKNSLIRIIGIITPFIIFIGYLTITGSLKYFIDYALLGIKTFDNSIPYMRLITDGDIVIRTLSIILPILLFAILIVLVINLIPNNRRLSVKTLVKIEVITIYSAVMLIVLYPISDATHFLIATLPLLIESIYCLTEILKKIYSKIKKFKVAEYLKLSGEFICVFTIISVGAIHTYTELEAYYKNNNKDKDIKHYKNIIVSNNMQNKIEEIENLIHEMQGKDVIILDAEACAYNIPLDRYYKNYDMFLKGNIGKDGEKGIINDIQNSSQYIYLTKKDKKRLNWQTPKEVIYYVENNLEKIGEMDIYNIYYKE